MKTFPGSCAADLFNRKLNELPQERACPNEIPDAVINLESASYESKSRQFQFLRTSYKATSSYLNPGSHSIHQSTITSHATFSNRVNSIPLAISKSQNARQSIAVRPTRHSHGIKLAQSNNRSADDDEDFFSHRNPARGTIVIVAVAAPRGDGTMSVNSSLCRRRKKNERHELLYLPL